MVLIKVVIQNMLRTYEVKKTHNKIRFVTAFDLNRSNNRYYSKHMHTYFCYISTRIFYFNRQILAFIMLFLFFHNNVHTHTLGRSLCPHLSEMYSDIEKERKRKRERVDIELSSITKSTLTLLASASVHISLNFTQI